MNLFVYNNRCRRNAILSIEEDDAKKLKEVRVSAITYLYDAVDINQVCCHAVEVCICIFMSSSALTFLRPPSVVTFFLPGWEH